MTLLNTACTSEPACDSEPEIRTTEAGVEFVRTPEACFEDLPDWDYEARYVELDGMRQAYVDEGDPQGPTVLLLHGNPSWSYLYRKMIPVLVDEGFRVVAMDHLGMGRSDKPVDIAFHTYLRHNDRLERFIEALDLTDIHLFAQDWGSLIGLRVAGLNLDRFASIAVGSADLPVVPSGVMPWDPIENPDVLEDIESPYAEIPPQQEPFYTADDPCQLIEPYAFRPWFIQWMEWSMKGRSYSPSHTVEGLTWRDVPADEEAAYDAPFPDRIYMAAPRTFPTLGNGMGGETQQAWDALLTFERPFLTLWGDNDYLDIGACAVQDNFVCNIPGAVGQPHARLAGASHFLQDDQGADIAARLVAFMRGETTYVSNYAASCESPSVAADGSGTPCTSDDDCEGLGASSCLLVSPEEGFCTVVGCESGSCVASFVCCRDCNPNLAGTLPFEESACFPEASAPTLTMQAGCTCD